jgi:hypothetical protein
MSSTVDIGELVVRISGDVRKLVSAQGDAGKALDAIDKKSAQTAANVQRNADLMARSVVALGVAFATGLFNRAVQVADSLNKLSAQTGVSVSTLSELKFVAEHVGVEFGVVEQALRGWNATLVEMSQNVKTNASIALRTLGVDIKDAEGNVRPFNEVLALVSDALAQYGDGANKAALATAIFKEGGAGLIPLLNLTSNGMKEVGQRAQDLGLIITEKGGRAARDYAAAMSDASQAVSNLAVELGGPILRGIAQVVDGMAKGAKATKDFLENTRVQALATEFTELTARQQQVIQELQTGVYSFGRNAQTARIELRALNEEIERNKQARGAIGAGTPDTPAGKKSDRLDQAPVMPDLPKMREELDAFIDKLNGLPVLMGQSFAFDATPFLDAMAKIDAATKAQAISASQGSRMKLQLARQEQDEILNTASIAANTLTTVFNKSKAAAIAGAIINTAKGVTKALSESAPPFNFINAGLVAAAGAAQIAAIRSTSQTGGGSAPSVGGGGSAGGGAEDAGPARAPQTLFVEGINPNQLLTGSMVRELAERLLEHQRDGGQVVLLPR